MSQLRAWSLRLAGLFGKEQKDRELAEELESHLQMHIDDNLRSGMDAVEARRRALIHLGGIERTKEIVRERRGIMWLESVLQDVRFGIRMLRKNPGITAVIVLTLALGIGVSTVMFSAVNAVLIRALPYGDPDRLAYVWVQNRNFPQIPANVMEPMNADFFDIQRQARSFSSLTFFEQRKFNLSILGFAQRIGGARVPGNFFSTLEVEPELGRAVDANDDQPGHDRVAVISHALWQSEFAGAADVLSQRITLDGASYQIIGVMPPEFLYPRDLLYSPAPETQIWLPAALTPQQRADRTVGNLATVGRLRPGVSLQQAQAEVGQILASVDNLHPPEIRGFYPEMQPFLESVLGEIRPQLLLLLAAATLVLLIACSNVANLLLARAASRSREICVRAALGAGRGRLIRQMLTEAMLLACAGGALGVLLALAALPTLLRFSPASIPRLDQTSLDSRVLLFSLGISILTGIVFGILPAAAAARIDLNVLLKYAGNRGATGNAGQLRSALVTAEVALAVVLLSGTVLLIRSFLRVQAVTTGFSTGTLTMNVALDSRYTQPEQRRAFFENVVDRVSKLPGIQAVGAANTVPLSNSEDMSEFTIEDSPRTKGELIATRVVTEHYFEAMGTRLTEGRFFTADASGGPFVVIVNQRFSQTYFAGRDPIGRRVRLGGSDQDPWRPIVGVVEDVRHFSLEDEPPAQVYVPLSQWDPRDVFVAVRSALPPAVTVPAIRAVVRSIDPAVAVSDIHTMDERISEATSRRRFQAVLLAVFGGAALLLAIIGLYGFVSYSVKQRTAEIGIRLALGAQRRDVLKLVLTQGMTLTLAGIGLGLMGMLAMARLLSSIVYDIAPTDHLTLATISLVLAAVALLACYIPARRATKVDPMVALRYE